MDDISAKLNEILSDPGSMQQIQNIMGSLGMNQDQNGGNNASPQSPGTGGMPDLSALTGMLGAMRQNQNGSASSPGTGGMPDLSALTGMLGSMGAVGQNQNGNTSSPGTGGMPDLSALTSMLGSMGTMGQNQNGGAPTSGTGGMPDLSALSGLLGSMGGNTAPASPQGGSDAANTAQMVAAISRIAPMLKKVNEEDDSTRFLRALRPLLGEARKSKLDESIKMMQMMRMLPLLKSSGMLSGLLG